MDSEVRIGKRKRDPSSVAQHLPQKKVGRGRKNEAR